VFNGTDEDDFLYCLPDNKETSVCREIAKSMGFSKLEEGLSTMSKDDLADSLAYNSIKVHKLLTLKLEMKYFIVMLNSFFFLQGLILSNALRAQKNACWGLFLKCYELRTRQHKMLMIKDLRPMKHYLP
jgi:hypothetical protein